MDCPFCKTIDTKVIDSRLVDDGSQVKRRRQCVSCNERFTTFETAILTLPRVIKNDGRRVSFEKEKLMGGFLKALEKRPVSMDAVETAVGRIIHRLQASGEREISSKQIGEWVMDALRQLDSVAYIRFASVYRSFEDVDAFQEMIARLKEAYCENTST